jgi:outer membrane receptor protein involved in Fe transport
VINGEEARSYGFEFEASARVTDRFDLSLGYSYTDAEVTESFAIQDLAPGGLFTVPPTTLSQILVFDGDPLPGVPKHSFTMAADYTQPLPNADWSLLFHVNGSYRSSAVSTFNPVTQGGRQYFKMEGFSIWDDSVHLMGDRFSVGFFADNIFDEEGTTAGLAPGLMGDRGAYFYVTRPRTMGLRFSVKTN